MTTFRLNILLDTITIIDAKRTHVYAAEISWCLPLANKLDTLSMFYFVV